jgi:pimeloyl-ACP methyl ester carboxylesterase
MPDFAYSGFVVHYTDTGCHDSSPVPVLVFIHGSCSSSRIFSYQLRSFQPRYRCVALDLFGHGKSSSPLPSSVDEQFYSLPALAKSIVALLSHLSIDRATLVGWSLGNAISLTIAQSYPNIVENLVLIAASPVFFLRSEDDEFPGMRPSQVKSFLDLTRNDYEEFYKDFVSQQYPEDLYGLCNRYMEAGLEEASALAPEVIYSIVSLSGNTDFRDVISKIKARTMIINGTRDVFCPVSAGKWMREHMGGESFLRLYECGHVPFVGPTSDTFNDDVVNFLEQGTSRNGPPLMTGRITQKRQPM